MSPIVTLLLQLIPLVPTALTQVVALYDEIKATLSPSDQATIEAALAQAQTADAAATAQADKDLTAAEQKP
jgi:hypothetical protein